MRATNSLAMAAVVLWLGGAQAAAQLEREASWNWQGAELSLGLGYLTGRSQEKVYDPQSGAKISQLFWEIEQAPTLHAGLVVEPRPWLGLSLSGWTKLDSGNSTMTDYDWLVEGEGAWSDRSYHPDTRLMRAYQVDAAASFWLLREDDWQLGLLLGYQHTHYKWEAKGGSYTYSSDFGFRDLQGNFPDGELGITYEQTYKAPYLGVVGRYRWGDWQIDASLRGSRWVDAEDYDIHHQRDTTFTGTGEGSHLRAASLGLAYSFSERLSLRGQVDYQEFSEGKGKVRIDEGGVREIVEGDAGGMSNRTTQGSLALRYRF
ncbi:omptin family outer membrane protease [Pseudomonas sp. CAU 1711]|uniref:omptin family outer membrane protease n=1 Tax=Pseudomonas sp. CAU 1711 TaxID=3140356 RepID=UPI00325FED8B